MLLVELSEAPPPGLQQSFAQCSVLPQFLHVMMSVLLVLLTADFNVETPEYKNRCFTTDAEDQDKIHPHKRQQREA